MFAFQPTRLGLLALLLLTGPSMSSTLPQRTGPVVLTVFGLDPARFQDSTVEFDVPMLESLATAEIETSSIWTDGTHRYTGVMLATLANYLNVGDATLKFHALNDYSIEFPAVEARNTGPLLAYEVDGELMPVRDKGPIWLIYPYDSGDEYRTDTIYSRSIWQLDRIEVLH
ncbi:MAG: oxidoreductase [bacterium]